MKPTHKWLTLAVIVVIAAGIGYALVERQRQAAAARAPVAAKAQTVVELVASDASSAQVREIDQRLPLSGTIKAVLFATVKAKVAGELRGLNLREGDTVRAGQLLGQIDTTEYQARVAQAQEQADAAKAQIDSSQRQWDNNKALVDQGFISKTSLETSWNTLVAARATHKAALSGVDLARKSLDDTVLRAPIDGVVAQRLVQSGERVGIDSRILDLVNLSKLEAEVSLSAGDSVQLRLGQTATLQVEGLPQPLGATVVRINPSTQSGSRSVLAYLALDKTDGLRQGLFVQGSLGLQRSTGLALPLSSVRNDKPTPYVQVVEADKLVHKTVTLGVRGVDPTDPTQETLVVVQGVEPGAQVLRANVGPLREGSKVRFTPAATPKAATP